MTESFLERCKMNVQKCYTQIKNTAAEKVQQGKAYAACYAQKAQAKAEQIVQKVKVQTQIACVVAKIQYAMLARRVQNKYQLMASRVHKRVNAVRNMWTSNQHFTFWFIPADGQHIAKTHVKKTHLKYAFTAVASFLVAVVCTIGVLAHFAFQNEAQKQELAEYKQTKTAQEQQIKELQQMAEKNQKQLAYLNKLEDQVRSQMEKNGAQLPPKSDASAYAGKGGPSLGNASELNVMFEQEKNIKLQADAKTADLENLLSAIENENYRRDVTPSQWPTDGGYVSSSYGGRANPFSGYGNYIRLTHDFGYATAYGHMSRLAVRAGSFVKKGQVIGYVGSTGYSTGPHLHFEVIKNGEQVDPYSLM